MTEPLRTFDRAQPETSPDSFRDWRETGRVYFGDGLTEGIDFLYDEIFHKEAYRRHGIRFREGQTVFDVGAHVGLFALYAVAMCKGNVELYCFEPIPQTFSLLQKNFHCRGLLDDGKVRLFNMGLAQTGSPAQAEFIHYEHASVLSTMKWSESQATFDELEQLLGVRQSLALVRRTYPRAFPYYWVLYLLLFPFLRPAWRRKLAYAREARALTCGMSSLSKVCRERQIEAIDLLKIDVEGAEWEVLNGIEEQDWPRIEQIVMEVNNVDGRLAAIEGKLINEGFDVITERPEWSEPGSVNIYFVYARRRELHPTQESNES